MDKNSLDCINHPPHYNQHPNGIECIDVVEYMNFCLGNAIKYIWRAGIKTEDPIEDIKKAIWYLNREIGRLERTEKNKSYSITGCYSSENAIGDAYKAT